MMNVGEKIKWYGEWPSSEEFSAHCHSFTPFVIQMKKTPQTSLFSPFSTATIASERIVDVSCSSTHEYYGNPASRTKVNMTFADFLSHFHSITSTTSKNENVKPNHLFLSQCCIYSVDKADVELPELESFAMNEQPSMIHKKDIQSINLWANIQPSLSGLHYDANHNILVVIEGQKTLYLFPPSVTDQMQPFCAYSETPNHSHLLPSRIKELLKTNHNHDGNISNRNAFPQPIIVDVEAGNALFIPEGWWHMVESTERTIALNYWFLSPLQKLLQHQAPHMTDYILRACVNALTSTSTAESLSIHNISSATVCSSGSDIDNESTKSKNGSKKRPRTDNEQYEYHHHQQTSATLDDWWQTTLFPACGTMASFENIWLPAAEKEPERFVEAVTAKCTPKQAAHILKQWDHYGNENGTEEACCTDEEEDEKVTQCFDTFFSHLGNERAQLVHERLLSLQAIYRRQQGTQLIQSILGS